ncbi:MAG: LPS export ABC transporter permease LptF [Alphaproteobacteria bacterium]
MKLVERYIFTRTATAGLMIFVALGTMIWLSQALRQFDLVTSSGQSIMTFLLVSSLMIPPLFSIVLPVALLIATVYTLASLNTDSELVVINASGASPLTVLRPALALGLLAMVLVGVMSIHFTPYSLRIWQEVLVKVRSDILSTVIREGQFMNLTSGLTFHMRERNADGSLGGIFLADNRDAETSRTYLADKGALLENPLGTFLIMSNGTIQQRSNADGAISMIEFSSYAFDLTSFTSTGGEERIMTASERPFLYLLNPDPDDRYLREQPEKFSVEIHKRLSVPLYALFFAVVPLVFLGQAESSRQSRAVSITMAIFVAFVVPALGFLLPGLAESSLLAFYGLYAVPLISVALCVLFVLTGVRIRPPERVVTFAERVLARASGVVEDRAPASG